MYQDLNVDYEPGQHSNWTGRTTDAKLGNQYWHQEIGCIDLRDLTEEQVPDIAVLGYVCDEGVRRNQGRVGACEGPKQLRERLAKLPIHFEGKRVVDIGDFICIDHAMESCQHALTQTISTLIAQHVFPIAIGGGHDIAYGHFMGIREALKGRSKSKIGIINFDAHFDLRAVEVQPNSGTPFNQILSELEGTDDAVGYFPIGIQQQSNTKALFDIARNKSVAYAMHSECESASEAITALQERLLPFIAHYDYLYITIDMDGFSSAYAPGVSAPSPLGFSPHFVFKMLRFLFDTKKVISCDIAELNPRLDRDQSTANLAARLVDFMVMCI